MTDNFFTNIISERYYFEDIFIHSMIQLIESRADSMNVDLSELYFLLDKSRSDIDSLYEDEMGSCKAKHVIGLSLLIKLFYPLMEQADKLIDDHIHFYDPSSKKVETGEDSA